MESDEQRERKRLEDQMKIMARQKDRAITYTDTDGCEVTVTPTGHVFYNAADWW
jgi:hypothetical protein